MGDSRDAVRRLDRAQRTVEYGLAVVIPVMLAFMLYSYILYDILVTPLFVITVVLAALLIVPAYQALRLHYDCWARNTMPQRLVTGLIGIIYISAASVFGVSIMSAYQGLVPQQPLLFLVLVLFVLLLIAIMAYNAKYKDRNERTDIRFYHKGSDELARRIERTCSSRAVPCTVLPNGRSTSISIPERKVNITIRRQTGYSSEVMLECVDPVALDLCSEIKNALDQAA
jgi:FlaA1/EpsC-like NDP-sugar epimerase